MMNAHVQALNDRYERLEKATHIVDAPEYRDLVVPNGNEHHPVHRWFHLKEAYSRGFLGRVVVDVGLATQDDLRILDPYCGVGTTCVSAADLLQERRFRTVTAYGVEANGWLHLVAATKVKALQRPPQRFRRFATALRRKALRTTALPSELPSLTTFSRPGYFDRTDLHQLMRLRATIDAASQAGEDPLMVDLARVCLGAIVEPVSNLRRDGRALRYTPQKLRPTTMDAFAFKASQMVEDLPASAVRVSGRVIRGDGRRLTGIDNRVKEFDLVIFSPPYPNNIDYTEIYKLENWLLGYISDVSSFRKQRLQTVYSHPSLLRREPLPDGALSDVENLALLSIAGELQQAIPSDRYEEGRRRMLAGYIRDMYLTLSSARRRVKPGGSIVYVVGNSVHGHRDRPLVIAADLLLAELAKMAQLRVERIAVARVLRRREADSRFLRESVVFLQDTRCG